MTFRLYEQYISVKEYLWKLILYAFIGIAVVSLLFLLNPITALIELLVIAMTIVEVSLFYYLFLFLIGLWTLILGWY